MSIQKLFSIVTVAYNAESLIEDTMMSVFSQTFTDFEYIIIDGKSTDDTMAILQKYRNKIDILISEKDKGIYDAMNKAICLASGKYINFMNCGDSFAGNSVLEKVSTLADGTNDVIFGNTIINTVIGKYLVHPGKLEEEIRRHMPFCHQSTFVKLEIAKSHLFDLNLRVAADYNMFFQLFNEKRIFAYIDEPIAVYQNDGPINHQSHKRILEAANVNQRLSTKIHAYYRYAGSYLRSLLPFGLYAFYRRIKYASNPRYKYLGN